MVDELQTPGGASTWFVWNVRWSIVQVVGGRGSVEGAGIQDFVEYRRKGPAFSNGRWGGPSHHYLARCPFRCVLKLCCSIDPDKERKAQVPGHDF